MSEEEINAALDKLEVDHGVVNEPVEPVVEVATEEVVEEVAAAPPGYKTYDEWIADGRDPSEFRGEKAYSDHYESLKEVRELKATMGHVVESVESWKSQQTEIMNEQIEQTRADTVAEFEKAKEDDDLPAALAARDKLDTLTPVRQQINPVISSFAAKNPIIDKNSTQYDAEFHQDVITIHNNTLTQMLGGDKSRAGELTQAQVERVQNMAFAKAKEIHIDKFVSPKNHRAAPATPARRPAPSNGDSRSKLKNITGNSRNQRDTNPGQDIYDHLKAIDPAAAENFAKNVLGDSNDR